MTRLIYPDTACILKLLDGDYGPPEAVLRMLPKDAQWVLSQAHFDDLTHAEADTRQAFLRIMEIWPHLFWGHSAKILFMREILFCYRAETPMPRDLVTLGFWERVPPEDLKRIGSDPTFWVPFDVRRLQKDQLQRAEDCAQTTRRLAAPDSVKNIRKIFERRELQSAPPPSPSVLAKSHQEINALLKRLGIEPTETMPEYEQMSQEAALEESFKQSMAVFRQIVGQEQIDIEAMRSGIENLLAMPKVPPVFRTLIEAFAGSALAFFEADMGAGSPKDLQAAALRRIQNASPLIKDLIPRRWSGDKLEAYLTYYLPNIHSSLWELLGDDRNAEMDFFQDCWDGRPSSCPATWASFGASQQVKKNKAMQPKVSDVTDLLHIAYLPYVDVFFCDNAMKSCLEGAGGFVGEEDLKKVRTNNEFGAFIHEG